MVITKLVHTNINMKMNGKRKKEIYNNKLEILSKVCLTAPYRYHCKHTLSHIEGMSPVVINYWSVILFDTQ